MGGQIKEKIRGGENEGGSRKEKKAGEVDTGSHTARAHF